jgi:hypothetical protein
MRNGVARIYLRELQRQCEYALQVIELLNHLLNAKDLTPGPIIRALDLFLGDVSRISLMLWPERRGSPQRGQFLRNLLRITDENPLKNREVRNAFQHMDERLDQWVKSPRSTALADFSTLPRGFVGGSLVGKENISRHYDPAQKVLMHFGTEVEIEVLTQAVADLRARVKALAEMPFE